MATFSALIRSAAVLAAVLASQVLTNQPDGTAADHLVLEPPVLSVAPVEQEARHVAVGSESIPVSFDPTVMVRGGTAEQHERLGMALSRFADAGLPLPSLEVVFDPTGVECDELDGVFRSGRSPWQIAICADRDFVYEHELAHAWEAANLTDEDRERYMEERGFSTWNDPAVPWGERACEDVAVTIQRALSGWALPETLSEARVGRLAAYVMLTGSPDPRLAEWVATYGGVDLTDGAHRAVSR